LEAQIWEAWKGGGEKDNFSSGLKRNEEGLATPPLRKGGRGNHK